MEKTLKPSIAKLAIQHDAASFDCGHTGLKTLSATEILQLEGLLRRPTYGNLEKPSFSASIGSA